MDTQKYGLHSLQAGGATAAANAGVLDCEFKRYIWLLEEQDSERWIRKRQCGQNATGIQIIGHLDVSCKIQSFLIAGFPPNFYLKFCHFIVLGPSSHRQTQSFFNIKFSCNCTKCYMFHLNIVQLFNIYLCSGLIVPQCFCLLTPAISGYLV